MYLMYVILRTTKPSESRQIFWSDQIKKDEEAGACGLHGTEEKCLQEFYQ